MSANRIGLRLRSKVSCPYISAGLCFPILPSSTWSRCLSGGEIRDLFISTHSSGTLSGMLHRTRLVLLSPLREFFIGLVTFDFVKRHWTRAECLFLLFHARFITNAAGRSQADSLNLVTTEAAFHAHLAHDKAEQLGASVSLGPFHG